MKHDSGLLEQFYSDGFVIVPGACSEKMCHRALRLVNKSLETQESNRDKKIWTDPDIINLFNQNSTITNTVESLIGQKPPFLMGAQIALRFPGTLCMPNTFLPVPFYNDAWHIDGLPTEGSGQTTIKNFTMLVGVCLQDVLHDLHGNLMVFPRSHHVLQDYFQKEGFEAAQNGLTKVPKVPLANPIQVKMRTGDVIFAHYSLAHSIAPNCAHMIRTMVYFRINVHPEGFRPDAMLDIWKDYPPIQRALSSGLSMDHQHAAEPTFLRAPGYIDAMCKKDLQEALQKDASSREVRLRAEALFEQHKWDEAAPLFEALMKEWEEKNAKNNDDDEDVGIDFLLFLRAGIAMTACSSRDKLHHAEKILQRLSKAAPSVAMPHLALCRNGQRQWEGREAPREVKSQWAYLAERALLYCDPASDCALDALRALRDSLVPYQEGDTDRIRRAAQLAGQRYPHLSLQLIHEVEVGDAWSEGKRWLQSPDPKNLIEGTKIFERIVLGNPEEYWGRILFSACLMWGGDGRGTEQSRLQEALLQLDRAEQIDPLWPHSYTVASQILQKQGRKEDAVHRVLRMLNRDVPIKCAEPDHYEKVCDAVQVLANCAPQKTFEDGRDKAAQLFPSLKERLSAIKPQEPGCTIC